jgi:hypothetical protein
MVAPRHFNRKGSKDKEVIINARRIGASWNPRAELAFSNPIPLVIRPPRDWAPGGTLDRLRRSKTAEQLILTPLCSWTMSRSSWNATIGRIESDASREWLDTATRLVSGKATELSRALLRAGNCGKPALPALLGRGNILAGPSGYWVGHSSGSFAVGLLSVREPGHAARLPRIYWAG